MFLSGRPTDPVVPSVVRRLAGAEAITAVWRNELGGLTFSLGHGPGRRFVKHSPPGGPDLRREVQRLRWVAPYASVPAVLESGSDEHGQFLLTAGIPGENAVTERWRADPAAAVRAIGSGLRRLHDAAPVEDCPFDWSADTRRTVIEGMPRQDPSRWHPIHAHLDHDRALDILRNPPPVDKAVVCHGDSCAPNTLLDEAGNYRALVDLGALGVADRWADLAVATWSTNWNYGQGWEPALLDAYGIDPDPDRTAYYRLLWDLGP
ncbi:kanamycin kinase [Nakamurella panacisegetis]|uniref:Kanamycin kinase n=1 Tax=Nakamurella panacisegetis TaxID=1090615 RepID=A0A1H0KHB2_9ACTN|nr:aminoglycoside 3'-phosphotransferase [Nakamurella panacisegetis]SDO55368.1 kanamycin kinase [Nakamurella panacisegetis]